MTKQRSFVVLVALGVLTRLVGSAVPGFATSTDLVSVRAVPVAPSGGFIVALSSDGRFALFASVAADLVAGVSDTNNVQDIFVRDLVMGTTKLVSINSAGTASGNGMSDQPVMSADGRFVAFRSNATDLVAGGVDSNGASDVFVRDMLLGSTVLVSVNSAGTASGNGASQGPAISDDGRLVAFASPATDLVTGILDTNGGSDVFVRDLVAGSTALASINNAGTGTGDHSSVTPAISGDGHVVAFESSADDLVAGGVDGNRARDVYARDLTAGITVLASINSTATASGNFPSSAPRLSADGRFVTFQSIATD